MFRITWAFRKYMYQLCLIKMKIDDFTEIAVTESVNRAKRGWKWNYEKKKKKKKIKE